MRLILLGEIKACWIWVLFLSNALIQPVKFDRFRSDCSDAVFA